MSLIELYNPLYLLPIVGVVFCALLVYAFGFKSTTLPPNFDDLDDSKKVTTKKKKVEKSLKVSLIQTLIHSHIVSFINTLIDRLIYNLLIVAILVNYW